MLNAVPKVIAAGVNQVIVGVVFVVMLCMLIVSVAVPAPALLLAEIVAVVLPATFGVPEINPVFVFMEAQEGRPVA